MTITLYYKRFDVVLYGRKGDKIKDLKNNNISYIIQVGLHWNHMCPYKSKAKEFWEINRWEDNVKMDQRENLCRKNATLLTPGY
jgi:hypothetical protein